MLKADVNDTATRPGLMEFLDHYSDYKKAVFSDAPREMVHYDLTQSGLIEKFEGIYDSRDCIREVAYSAKSKRLKELIIRSGGGNIKNLAKACSDFSVIKSDAVFIGDNFNGKDKQSAQIHQIKFIRVPQYRSQLPDEAQRKATARQIIYESQDNPFSFTSLIGKL